MWFFTMSHTFRSNLIIFASKNGFISEMYLLRPPFVGIFESAAYEQIGIE